MDSIKKSTHKNINKQKILMKYYWNLKYQTFIVFKKIIILFIILNKI